jgi:CspA family cold shock protein
VQALVNNFYCIMQTGTIARLTDKGFGFISRDGEQKDLFFHSNELVGVSFDELREGDKVTFEVADSPKGPNAVKVSRA